MDTKAIAVLKADLLSQMALIDTVFNKVAARVVNLSPEEEIRLESAAYQLHNLYNAVEDLFKTVASHFENQIGDNSRWHIAILQRMRQEIEGVRPALLSQDAFDLLNGLRAFRHFFRHAYNAPIEYTQLCVNLDRAQGLQPLLKRDVARFLEAFA